MPRKRKLICANAPVGAKSTRMTDFFGKQPPLMTSLMTEPECSLPTPLSAILEDDRHSDIDLVESVPSVVRPNDITVLTTPKKSTPRKHATPTKYVFKDSWQINRPWLKYDSVKRVMLCTVCINAGASNLFVSGCSTMNKDYVVKHETCTGANSHIMSLKNVEEGYSMQESQKKVIAKAEKSIVAAMKNVYFLAKHHMPSSLFGDLNDLCIDQGNLDLPGLKVDKHTTYDHHTSVSEFHDAIVSVINDKTIADILQSPVYSIMLDESTDISTSQNVVIYGRYIARSEGRFIPKSVLLKIQELPGNANAENITDTVISVLDSFNLDGNRLCGMATDGASVMTSKKSGVAQRIKEIHPQVLSVHCIAHRLSLASCSAADSVPYLVKYQHILNSIYSFFSRSPKHLKALESVQNFFDVNSTKIKQVCTARWLSFEGSVSSIVTNYSSLLKVFHEDLSTKSAGLYKSIATYKFMYVSCFLKDVLAQCSVLCKLFQCSVIDYTDIEPLISSTVTKIKKFTKFPGAALQAFLTEVPTTPQSCDGSEYDFSFTIAGHDIKDSMKMRSDSVTVTKKFVAELVDNLSSRFAASQESDVLVGLSKIFDLSVKDKSLEKDITKLVEYFKTFGDPDTSGDTVRNQIADFRDYCREKGCVHDIDDGCQAALKQKETFPVVCNFAERLLCVPVSTVDCERAFSVQNLIKTKLRNRLSVTHLNALMTISIDGPSLNEFEFKTAFNW